MRHLPLLSLLLFAAIPHPLRAQTGSDSTREKSSPAAIATIEAAVAAMGGKQAWEDVGGATAQVVITPQHAPAQTVQWTDDWTKKHLRFRRDSGQGSQAKSGLLGSEESQMHIKPDGKVEYLMKENDIAVLAIGYPAAALILSSKKHVCAFQLGAPVNLMLPIQSEDADDIDVMEECQDPSYPNGVATLAWKFSRSTGLPKSVELPLWGQSRHVVLKQFVTYTAFQKVQGKSIPTSLKIRRISGWTDDLMVSNTVFVNNIADEKFRLAGQQ